MERNHMIECQLVLAQLRFGMTELRAGHGTVGQEILTNVQNNVTSELVAISNRAVDKMGACGQKPI